MKKPTTRKRKLTIKATSSTHQPPFWWIERLMSELEHAYAEKVKDTHIPAPREWTHFAAWADDGTRVRVTRRKDTAVNIEIDRYARPFPPIF